MLLIIRQVSVVLVLLTILLGGFYPTVITGISKALFPAKVDGSLIKDSNGNNVGSELIGQSFSDPKYFWGRLSATSPMPYNAASSSGSNLSNGNENLLKIVQLRIDELKKADPENKAPIPVDLVTASASGLDPHISIAAAQYQAARIAKIRSIREEKVVELIDKYTEDKVIGIIGEPVVNVLKLNLALDELK